MKLVSVIFPSRDRCDKLGHTLDSVLKNCSNVNNIEILVKVDSDDLNTIDFLKKYGREDIIKVIISDRKNGYESLHEYYNELYENSVGEFIFCINDDLTVDTVNWDLEVSKFSGEFVCLHHNPTPPHNDVWYFPVISKKILDVIGHVSMSVFYDGYLFYMLKDLNLFRRVNITINHTTIDDNLTKDKLNILQRFRETSWEFDTKQGFMSNDRDKIIKFINNK
jgi:hypothetical protein